MYWLSAFIIVCYLNFSNAGQRRASKTWYPLQLSDTIKECENFTNNAADVSGLFLQNDTLTTTSLSGTLIVRETLGQGGILEVIMKVYKEHFMRREIFYILSANLCDHMDDRYAPWSPIFDAMNTHSCPIEADTYLINNMKLDLEYAKPVLNHEYIGEYIVSIELMTQKSVDRLLKLENPQKPISCHTMMLTVSESKEDQNQE